MPALAKLTDALSFGKNAEQQDDSAMLSAICDEAEREYPDVKFAVYPNGDIVVPRASVTTNVRLVTYLRQQVRMAVGIGNLRVLSNTAYESETAVEHLPEVQADAGGVSSQNQQMLEVLDGAIKVGASDTYIDVGTTDTTVSYRVHGLKQPSEGRLTPDQGFDLCRALWSRADESFEERMACDCSFVYEGLAFRGNSLPTHDGGVGVVLRMRDPNFYLPLNRCGYSGRQIASIKGAMESPGGLILLTGETNSGKSSTMATLMGMMPETIKAVEISDPVEVAFPHITQVAIPKHSEDADLRFAKILSALVRQNPRHPDPRRDQRRGHQRSRNGNGAARQARHLHAPHTILHLGFRTVGRLGDGQKPDLQGGIHRRRREPEPSTRPLSRV